MTKTETNEPHRKDFNSFESEPHRSLFQSKIKSRRWAYAKPDLTKQCFICDQQIQVKYILPKKRYSQKNNWGYWTKKTSDQHKYLCNTCLWKLHVGKMSDWIECQSRADVFYNYIKKGQFGSKDF